MQASLFVWAFLPVVMNAMLLPGNPSEYYDILGTGHSDWRLAFRGTAHIGRSLYEAYRTGAGIPAYVEDGCKSVDWKAPCSNHYRNNDALDNWSNVREVLYGLVDHGMLVKVLRFKAMGTNKLNWMTQKRLTESCYEDLKYSKPNYFGVEGHASVQRRFYINNNYGGCPTDAGWTMVVDQGSPPCAYEKNETWPYIKYSASQTYENMNSAMFGSADSVVVFLNYFPGEPREYHDLFHTGKKEWRLAFRGTANIVKPVYPAYLNGAGISSSMEPACRGLDWSSPCTSHYRNDDALNRWKDIEQVLFGVIQGGEMVKTIFFNGENTTYLDWFEKAHLQKSCWDDLPAGPYNHFSIEGHAQSTRRFFINRKYAGCPGDLGWVVVTDSPPNPCPWEVPSSGAYPSIHFAAGPKVQNWSTGEVLEADAITVFLKYKSL